MGFFNTESSEKALRAQRVAKNLTKYYLFELFPCALCAFSEFSVLKLFLRYNKSDEEGDCHAALAMTLQFE